MKGDREVEHMNTDVRENRDKLIECCIDNGMRLANTMFQKPIDKLVTYRPLITKKHENITANNHDQSDYIITQKSCLTITDCETDTKSILLSDHFPIIAEMNIKFRQKTEKYIIGNKHQGKSLWKNKEGVNSILQ